MVMKVIKYVYLFLFKIGLFMLLIWYLFKCIVVYLKKNIFS